MLAALQGLYLSHAQSLKTVGDQECEQLALKELDSQTLQLERNLKIEDMKLKSFEFILLHYQLYMGANFSDVKSVHLLSDNKEDIDLKKYFLHADAAVFYNLMAQDIKRELNLHSFNKLLADYHRLYAQKAAP